MRPSIDLGRLLMTDKGFELKSGLGGCLGALPAAGEDSQIEGLRVTVFPCFICGARVARGDGSCAGICGYDILAAKQEMI